jgi:hypothetical protein
MNSGYRTRYPHVAVGTNGNAGREEWPALQGRHDRIIGIPLRQMNLAYYFYGGLGNTSMARLTVCRQDFFDNLGKQSEKSERCQSHARVSGEPSHGLGFVFPILRTLIGWFPRTTAALLLVSDNHLLVAKLILATAVSSWQMCS